MSSKQKQLQKILSQLAKDAPQLPLAGQAELTVPAEGNPEAKIFFIGEAAGFYELQQHRPFVGVAGQLLTRTLEKFGIHRKDVWISNIIKARPPGNRDPLPDEIAAYQPYLDAELAVIQPRLVVTLGRFSLYKFLGDQVRISQIHGQPRWASFSPTSHPLLVKTPSRLRFVVMPMYHPAAALRSGAVMTAFESDFQKIPVILKKLAAKAKNGDMIAPLETQPNDKDRKDEQLSLI